MAGSVTPQSADAKLPNPALRLSGSFVLSEYPSATPASAHTVNPRIALIGSLPSVNRLFISTGINAACKPRRTTNCQNAPKSRPPRIGLKLKMPQTIVESPFTFEQEAKQGTYLWLSAYPIPKDEENLENLQLPKTVEVKIFIDDKLHKSNSGENYAMVQHIFGQEDYQ